MSRDSSRPFFYYKNGYEVCTHEFVPFPPGARLLKSSRYTPPPPPPFKDAHLKIKKSWLPAGWPMGAQLVRSQGSMLQVQFQSDHSGPRPAMASHGLPWLAMNYHGWPWPAMGGVGQPCP